MISLQCLKIDYQKVTSRNRFELLLHSLKWKAIGEIQNEITEKADGMEVSIRNISNNNRMYCLQAEEVFNNSMEYLAVRMMRDPKRFKEIQDPMAELLGRGMAYVGLIMSEHKALLLTVTQYLSNILEMYREGLQETHSTLQSRLPEGCIISPWSAKKTTSIYTKVTDYAIPGGDPVGISSSGLLGIKDYLRSRLIVPNSLEAADCARTLFETQNAIWQEDDETRAIGLRFTDLTFKDKSKRFASCSGQAIYVTGYLEFGLAEPIFRVFEDSIKLSRYELMIDGNYSDSKYTLPVEVQVLNENALQFINQNHGNYELVRMLDRISAVCDCTRDENGDLVPQSECIPCGARLKASAAKTGYCAFCHGKL